MSNRPSRPQPPLLFGVAVFAALALLLGRGVLPRQDPPALAVVEAGMVRVLLGDGFSSSGVHQFSDGSTLADVINLTHGAGEVFSPPGLATGGAELADGMALAIAENPSGIREISVDWMPARQRLALGIPLHPDRMSREDWVSLPGIGEKLAQEIELDRQKFGNFGRFEALERVKGIGPAKLQGLKTYFVASGN